MSDHALMEFVSDGRAFYFLPIITSPCVGGGWGKEMHEGTMTHRSCDRSISD